MNNFTNEMLKEAAAMITRLSKLHGVPENEIRAELLTAMRASRNNPDPAVQERWSSFAYSGSEPTADEFLAWVLAQSISAAGK